MELRVSVVLAEEGRKVLLDIRWSGCRARILPPQHGSEFSTKFIIISITCAWHFPLARFRTQPKARPSLVAVVQPITTVDVSDNNESKTTRTYEVAGRDSDRLDVRTMTTARYIGLSHRMFTGRDNKAGSKGEQNFAS